VISTEKGFNEHRANPKKCLGVNNTPQLPKVPTMEKEACMGKEHQEKKNVQKKYQEALNALNIKVKDHDHINGKYHGPAHNA
ncbi:36317_t:CDS:2, partial [Gigaspora margarita]